MGEGWRRVDFNDSYRVVGGWWRNLEFGGWKVNYFEDGGWRMKVKNKIMKFFFYKSKCLFPVRQALGQSNFRSDKRHMLPPLQYP